jgi:hypothetical protein
MKARKRVRSANASKQETKGEEAQGATADQRPGAIRDLFESGEGS